MTTKLVGVLFHPRVDEAQALARELAGVLKGRGHRVWLASAWKEQEVKDLMGGTDVVVSVGGDGTILRAARAIVPAPAPILGIRYGRLGFLADISPDDALRRVPELIENAGHVDVRAMLRAHPATNPIDPSLSEAQHPLMNGAPEFHALNDVVVSRGSLGRPIYVKVAIDGQNYFTYRADAVIVSTATGSTGYALSAGGPILHPSSRCYVLIAVAAHAAMRNALVLEPASSVELVVRSDHGAMLSIDGQVDVPLEDGEVVEVTPSQYVTRFLRALPADDFYATVHARLRYGETPAT